MQPCEGLETKPDCATALDIMLSAWDEGSDIGLTPEIIAFGAILTGVTELVSRHGEQHVAVLVERLGERIRRGEFTHYATTQ